LLGGQRAAQLLDRLAQLDERVIGKRVFAFDDRVPVEGVK